ncbi:EamA family transporter [Haloferacaceae archaeon DSL9]
MNTSITLSILAAIGFGVQVLLVERGLDRLETEGRGAVAATALTLPASAGVLWLFVAVRTGSSPIAALSAASSLVVAAFVAAGVADPAATRLLFYEGIDRLGPNLATAIVAGSPAVAAVLAVALGESVTGGSAIGLALIVVGVGALHLRPAANAAATDVLGRELRAADRRDFVYPLGAMLTIGGAAVVVDAGLARFPDALLATALTQTVAVVAFFGYLAVSAPARAAARTGTRPARGLFALAGAIGGIAWYGMFAALQSGSVVVVLPLASTYPLVVVALSYAAARELPRSPRALAAILCIVLGAALLQGDLG